MVVSYSMLPGCIVIFLAVHVCCQDVFGSMLLGCIWQYVAMMYCDVFGRLLPGCIVVYLAICCQDVFGSLLTYCIVMYLAGCIWQSFVG